MYKLWEKIIEWLGEKFEKIKIFTYVCIPSRRIVVQRKMESHDFKYYLTLLHVSFFFNFFLFFININLTIMLKRASMKFK